MNAQQRLLAVVLATAIGLPSFALSCFAPLSDPDVGWHLAFGEYIVGHQTIPTTDVFRFTPQESRLHLHGWLSQVAFYLLERIGGLGFFRFGTSLVMLGTLALLARLLYKMNGNIPLTALGVLVYVLTSIHLFHPRARIFTPPLFMLAFEQLGIDDAPLSGRQLLGLFLLTVVWMNLHAEATILPLFIVVLLLGQALTRPFPRQRIVSLALAAALTFAASFVSPLGATWVADAAQNYHVNRENSWEWFNLFAYQGILDRIFSGASRDDYPMFVHLLGHPFSLYVTLIVAACYLASLALRRNGADGLPRVLVNLWALFFAFNMQRNSWLLFIPIASALRLFSLRFARIAPPEAARSTSRRQAVPPTVPRSWQAWAATAALLLATAFTFKDVMRPGLWRIYDDDGWDARMFPTKAVAFVEAAGLRGNAFNQQEWGGYLIHQRPDILVFMHGHWAEAPKTYADYQAIFEQRAGFADLLERYGATLLVVPPSWGTKLPRSKWIEVFRNLQSGVYVRSDDATSLASVEAYYRTLSIPFSRTVGFDPQQALAMAPAWAQQFRLQRP